MAVLVFGLGRLSPRILAWFRYRHAKRFWRPVTRRSLTVVVGRHDFPTWEAAGLMGIGDAKAIDELRRHFRAMYLSPDFDVSFVDELPRGRTRDGNLVCIGGPDTSVRGDRMIADLWRNAPTSLVWGDSDDHDVAIQDRRSGELFAPKGPPGDVTRDYALIVKMPNPYSQPGARESVLLFAGCVGYGTWGAVRFATTDAFARNSVVAAAGSVECLVSVNVAGGAPQLTELLKVRPLR